MPKLVVWIMGLLCILVGGMTFMLPVVFLKVLGLIDIAIGFKIIARQTRKENWSLTRRFADDILEPSQER
jgi:hypothetical protein